MSLEERLESHEGFEACAFQDHLGFWTIGHGICIDKRVAGAGITEEESRWLLRRRVENVRTELDRHMPWWRGLPDQTQEALTEMGYQLGTPKLLGFRRMWDALSREDWRMVEVEALDSNWARQTPARAREVVKRLVP